ncbi:unnamed protein product, partial [Linum tenue]
RESGDDDDRLSSLPDEITSHLLSFLETKYAVGTSVLSRRWKDCWTRVSNLDLDNSLILRSLDEAPKLKCVPNILNRRHLLFTRFVDKVLGQHASLNSVRRFRFHLSHSKRLSEARFDRKLVFGALMEEIDVMISKKQRFGEPLRLSCIPESFYTLKNLRVAELSGVVLGATNQSVFLPNVEILKLCSVEIDFDSLGSLLSGCPVLETAHLESCKPSSFNSRKHVIEVSLPSLKKLKIGDDMRRDVMLCPFVIEAPNLEDLYLKQFVRLQFKGSSPLSWLNSASVDTGYCEFSNGFLMRLLNQISNAKKMCLSRMTLNNLWEVDDVKLPVFPNLTHLTIGTGGSSWILHSLLKSASKLRSLVVDMKLEKHSGEPMLWESLETASVPECLSSTLEEIEIKDLVAYQDEMNTIAYLLNAGAVLKQVNMHVNGRYLELNGREELDSLLKFSRRSSACEARLLFPNIDDIYTDSDDETYISDDAVWAL